MNYETRKHIYEGIEKARGSKLIALVNGDRGGLETQIAADVVELLVNLLDQIGPTRKISLLLHSGGGQTSAAWRIINLLHMFCDELEVIIPIKALSAGTLISLGADTIVMTKQAALGPIDPSLHHPLGPTVPNTHARAPVSVEAVRGYLGHAQDPLGIRDPSALASIWMDLSNKIHPLVLGEILRSQTQIRFLAGKLIKRQVDDPDKIAKIIDFLCAESGSHDYTINRREAQDLGLRVEKPDAALYPMIQAVHKSYTSQLKTLEPYLARTLIAAGENVGAYSLTRGLLENSLGGSYEYITEGTLTLLHNGPQELINDVRSFDGWRKV